MFCLIVQGMDQLTSYLQSKICSKQCFSSDMFIKETFLNVVKQNGTEVLRLMLKVCTECVMLSSQR